ncbi:hypothetical protein ACN38_g12220 [Penicillium nordicum]|uniref:Uncharacterized protein n=1 Tax=Penicillium nordicum TaxID=229535 RepID=A0A0M9WA27_9EURO|nr:hypothetical protein ACN38_g12220 [Penicillium nordicum]
MVNWRWRDGPVSIRGSFCILALQSVNRFKATSRLDLRKSHKAQSPTQPNPHMGWALIPTFGPTGGLWARGTGDYRDHRHITLSSVYIS